MVKILDVTQGLIFLSTFRNIEQLGYWHGQWPLDSLKMMHAQAVSTSDCIKVLQQNTS